ncbi:hypothetical protein [Nocardioides sp.]|uniref:hypothetical protein n=1 Tax=Nocardioides sp. TaxID=35761 RepID=UPI002718A377|nr:hypothetical protein [Nocardioides sp.]MDO9454882.1 hypothetical protein [Nocardioides sp.]
MANHRHKRETNARRLLGARLPRLSTATLAAPLAVVATAGVVSFGVAAADVSPVGLAAAGGESTVVGDTAAPAADLAGVVLRGPTLSRGSNGRVGLAAANGAQDTTVVEKTAPTKLERVLAPAAVKKAVKNATTERWTTEPLNLWAEPGEKSAKTGEVAAGEQVLVTGRELFGRVEIVWEKTQTRWVTAGYLTDQEPFTLGGACTNGTSVPSGVSPNIVKVHDAVCAEFPDITVYGTFRGDGEHSQGLAVDIMVSGSEGQAVADFVRKYYAELGVNYVIYSQHIWSVQRSGEGWRGMSDRGSTTANHYDHVHVTTY